MENLKRKVAILMGSKSDEAVMKPASEVLESFGIEYEIRVSSAHRMPDKTRQFAVDAKKMVLKLLLQVQGKQRISPVLLHPAQLFR